MSKWYKINIAQLLVLLEKLNLLTLLKTTFMLFTVSNFHQLKTSLELEMQNHRLWVSNLSLKCLLWSNDCSILSSRSLNCLGCQNNSHLPICSLLMSQLMGTHKKLMSLSKLCKLKNKHCKPMTNNYNPKIKLWKFIFKNFLRSRMKINLWNLNFTTWIKKSLFY